MLGYDGMRMGPGPMPYSQYPSELSHPPLGHPLYPSHMSSSMPSMFPIPMMHQNMPPPMMHQGMPNTYVNK